MQGGFQLAKGRIIGQHYKILEYLGGGWEGEVYKVEECDTKIFRAAKLFYQKRGGNKQPHVVYAKKLFNLRHCPVIIQYHTYSKTIVKKQSVDFLISDFIEGDTLPNFLKKQKGGRLDYFEALHLFYSLVHGVEQIHYHGEYHGDIHPGNIFVKRAGLGFEVKLIDLIHLGRPTKNKIQDDVVHLLRVFYEIIGGAKYYRNCHKTMKEMVCGRRSDLIKAKFIDAGSVRLYLENLS